MRMIARRPETWVFLILLVSYAFFWHRRDWNTASRLMLTYAFVDRGTVAISGLEIQTEDKAKFEGQFYSDKFPGFSLLATVPYAIARLALGLPAHPTNQKEAFPYWAADYWCTLGTSGLFTAGTAVLLALSARELGCSARTACFIGLAYGLATPAYVYATLAYGHQTSAFALFASFFLLGKKAKRPRESYHLLLAGFLAAYAAVIELQVGPVSAILGFYLLAQCLRRDRRPDALALFAVGAMVPTLILLTYNQLAFGSPWDMGYSHHTTFGHVHSAENPLGLAVPDQFWRKLLALLWGRHRGLAFYAPILLLAIPGWVALALRRNWDAAVVTFSVSITVLLVNLFYPEWTGGWSTGPRLLVPMLPFAMLPVAALLSGESPRAKVATSVAVVLALAGGVLMLLFQSVGGRIPQDYTDPLVQTVWPVCTAQGPLPRWRFNGERFSRNVASLIAPDSIDRLPARWQFVQFVPLALLQVVAIAGLFAFAKKGNEPHESQRPDAAFPSPMVLEVVEPA